VGVAALLVALPLLSYSSSLRNGWVFDDLHTIHEGRLIGSLANLPRVFTHDTMYNSFGDAWAQAPIDTYRPLTMTTFFLERALWDKRPFFFHLDSVLLHGLVVVLTFLVGRRLGLSEAAAACGSLLFAVHPALVEAVHWVNGRSDPLVTALDLGAVLVWLVALERMAAGVAPGPGRMAAVAGLAFAAGLSKETAFTLGAANQVLLLRLLPRPGGRPQQPPAPFPLLATALRATAPWAIGLGLALACRLLVLRRVAVATGSSHLFHALARVPAVWLDALASLLFPRPRLRASLVHPYRTLSIVVLAGALVLLAALAWGAVRLLRRRPPAGVIAGWAWATLLLAMAPVALLTHTEGWSGWGRYLYPAAPSFSLCVGLLLVDLARPRLPARLGPGAALLGGGLLLLLSVQTFTSAWKWRDDRHFNEALIEDDPLAPAGHYGLALDELREPRSAEENARAALPLLQRCVELDETQSKCWGHLAWASLWTGQRPRATQAAARALALDPASVIARHTRSLLLLVAGRDQEAAGLMLEVLAAEPEQPAHWAAIADGLRERGRTGALARALRSHLAEDRYRRVRAEVLGLLDGRPQR
jgi:hypothetical protein